MRRSDLGPAGTVALPEDSFPPEMAAELSVRWACSERTRRQVRAMLGRGGATEEIEP